MKQIIIDTNALMAISEFKIDLFSAIQECCDFSYKLNVLQGTLDELDKIEREQKGKFKRAANLASKIIKSKKVNVINKKGNVDNLLVDYSKKGYLVLTQDIILKRRLKKPYLTIRQKKRIIVVN